MDSRYRDGDANLRYELRLFRDGRFEMAGVDFQPVEPGDQQQFTFSLGGKRLWSANRDYRSNCSGSSRLI